VAERKGEPKMQRAIQKQASFANFQTQATSVIPGHVSGSEKQAVNDESYQDESSLLKFVFTVLANVIGGTILLATMFILPHLVARLLG
jgi:hypothetical protein